MALPRELLDLLVCPETHAPLVVDAEGHLVSTSPESRRRYRVEDDIPNMLIEDAEVLSPEQHQAALQWAADHAEGQPAPWREAQKA